MRLFDKAKWALNTLANLDEEKLDPSKVVENELMNMILESYWRFFSAIFYANEWEYEKAFILVERIIEEVDWYEDYCEWNQISQKSRAFWSLNILW